MSTIQKGGRNSLCRAYSTTKFLLSIGGLFNAGNIPSFKRRDSPVTEYRKDTKNLC